MTATKPGQRFENGMGLAGIDFSPNCRLMNPSPDSQIRELTIMSRLQSDAIAEASRAKAVCIHSGRDKRKSAFVALVRTDLGTD